MAVNVAQYGKIIIVIVLLILVLKFVVQHYSKSKVAWSSEGFSNLDDVQKTDKDITTKLSGDARVATGLLPKPQVGDEEFSQYAPKAGKGQNFLDATKFVGIDTVGSTLKNANYDLRSAVVIPKKNISPWQNSTIEPDLLRRRSDL